MQVSVVDVGGHAIANAVVVATPINADNLPPATAATAVMDQTNKQFVPEVLVVRKGTLVAFPNSDSIAHQVYSFSPAKRFELPLYRGRAHPPVLFDQPGIVVLGCNIHDRMAGYIYVTASPYFGKTDAMGRAQFTQLPAGNYKVTIWSPYFTEMPPEQSLGVSASDSADLRFALTRNLRPQQPPIDPRVRDY